MPTAKISAAILGMTMLSCASSKEWKEDQCYQPLYWPSDCERIERPPIRNPRPAHYNTDD